MKRDSMIRLRVLLGFIVYSASLGTTKHSQNICPGCYRCETDHRIFNGTTVEFVTALCHFRAGVKMTSIPQNLPSRLSTLTMTSQNIRELETSSLRKYPFLHILCLDRNGLQTIQNGSFSRQQFLTELDLKENELLEISAETFRGLKSLTKLRLDHNKLQRISRATFATVSLIKELDLRANRIIELEEGAFDKLDYLETILLSSNQLRSLNSGVLGNLMSLTRLELASNQITGIDEGTFGCAPILKRLVLKGNRMEKIPKESITHLRFLNNLDISENPVSFVGSDDLIGLKSLKTMHLNDCNISWIQDNAFYRLQEPITIHLKNNPLNCNCHLSWLPRFLSKKTNLTLSGAVCQAPRDISGKNIASANVQSFVCTCADCTCDQQPTNCSCAKNWIGLFCSDNCQSYNVSLSMCSKFGDKCFCGKSATLEKTAKSSNCSFNVTSTNCSDHGEVKKDGAHLKCVCKPGFTGNGLVCSDVDECVTAKGCPYYEHADCINTLGSYHCKCRKGFRHSAHLFCEDIDECEESQPCDKHANCHNSKGSHTCLCLPGYTGDGKTCLPLPYKPSNLMVTEIDPSKVSVTWSVANISIIKYLTVEYQAFATGSRGWKIIVLQPHETKTQVTDLRSDSTYLLRIGVFSIFNTSIYSDETTFATYAAKPSVTNRVTNDSRQNTLVIAVSVGVSIVVLGLIALVLFFLMKRQKRRKSKAAYPQYVAGLEDLIEMRTRSHSGGAESRGNRELLELGSNLHVSCGVDYHDEWEISRDLLVIGQKIGEGQFGLVLEGTLMTEDGSVRVAVKTVKEGGDRFDIRDLLQEMSMMKEIGQHPHVVSLVGTCTTPGPLYIITEYVSGGSLLDYLRSSRPVDETYVNVASTLSSRDLLKIALDCARGMNHIANKKFVHRDLAARNILLTEDYEAKVADFGLARDIYGDGQYVKTGGGRLPIKWMAPECIQDQIYTTMSDVWSFGVLLWEIVTIGGAPYPGVPVNLLLTKLLCGYRMSKPAHCSEELYDLMATCWELNPEARPNFSEICHTLLEMLSESARSYVNISVSDNLEESGDEEAGYAHDQAISV